MKHDPISRPSVRTPRVELAFYAALVGFVVGVLVATVALLP